MDAQEVSEWLASLSPSETIRALAEIYSELTIRTRELFLPERGMGEEASVLDMLRGMNEVHHTLSGALLAYTGDGSYPHSLEGLARKLFDNAKRYGIEYFLQSAIEATRNRTASKSGDSPVKRGGLN